MGLFSRNKPKIKVQTTKKDGFSGWLKCTHCNELIHANELEQNQNCCPKCDYHYRLSVEDRIKGLADADTFRPILSDHKTTDPLQYYNTETYPQRIQKAKEKSGLEEAAIVGTCFINGQPVALGVLDFNFMAGSMGSVVGEKITSIIEL